MAQTFFVRRTFTETGLIKTILREDHYIFDAVNDKALLLHIKNRSDLLILQKLYIKYLFHWKMILLLYKNMCELVFLSFLYYFFNLWTLLFNSHILNIQNYIWISFCFSGFTYSQSNCLSTFSSSIFNSCTLTCCLLYWAILSMGLFSYRLLLYITPLLILCNIDFLNSSRPN